VKEMLLKTRRGLFLLLVLIVSGVYALIRFFFNDSPEDVNTMKVPEENVYVFSGISGPARPSTIPPRQVASWRTFNNGAPSAMAILLTDTQSHWLGLVQGLTSIGIPFTITTNTAEALRHKVVMVYPLISGKVLSKEDLQAIAAVPRNGGTLIATNVYGGGLNEVFAYDDYVEHKSQSKVRLNLDAHIFGIDSVFADAIYGELILSGSGDKDIAPGLGYTNAKTPLMSLDDGTACLAFKDYGSGKAFALGLDLGNYFLRNMNGRGVDSSRAYANNYEAGIDIFLRVLKQVYTAGEPNAVTICPVPDNKSVSMIITHDIDFTKSMVNAAKYASMEKEKGVKATYFIQTKYVRDWNDDIFFNNDNVRYLQHVLDAGMEVGSHSVSHSRVFSRFASGTGNETYPEYVPFVKERSITYNGSILGELRVSKFLLEHFAAGATVSSFRPGHLENPFSLPQALQATGFANSSSVTGGNVQTNLPYMLMYNREFDAPTSIVEIPIAVEDELGLPMLQRFDSTVLLARKLSKYGGVLNILIHTDTLGQKYDYEKKVIDALKSTAWIGTIGEFGDWWRQRNDVRVEVKDEGKQKIVTVGGPNVSMKGLTLQVPAQWELLSSSPGVTQHGRAVVIDNLDGNAIIKFKVRS
jgi:hypothetical protein